MNSSFSPEMVYNTCEVFLKFLKKVNPLALKDVCGPVMIGPSSSHTLGALRIARFVHNMMGRCPKKVHFQLHQSFARTYQGHGTDRALLGGIMGLAEDDPSVKDALQTARQQEIDFAFEASDLGDTHPNTVRIEAWRGNLYQDVWGSSIGAGMIEIIRINGVECQLSGMYPTLIIINRDTPKALGRILECIEINVANLFLRRIHKLIHSALTIAELDQPLPNSKLLQLRLLDVVEEVQYVPSLEQRV